MPSSVECADYLMTVVPPMMREMWNRLQAETPLPVTNSQYGLLSLLYHQEGLTVSELARRWGVSAPTMSKMVSLLGKRGLVRRVECPEDSRCKLVSLTAAGGEVIGRVREAMRQSLARSLDQLDDMQRSQILATLNLLSSILT